MESPYKTSRFEAVEDKNIFSLRKAPNDKHLNGVEYVSLISDIIRMRKNVCLCRHFNSLNKGLITTKSAKFRYIDVWPVNFFEPNPEDPFDTSSLFMLQLACIINMVRDWKHLQLRVFLCDSNVNEEGLTELFAQKNSEQRFRQLLHLLRIKASIHPVAEWSRHLASLRGRSVFEVKVKESESPDNTSQTYLMNANSIIRQHSENTALTLIYLPLPHASDAESATEYLHYLTALTNDLPATVLVHGISTVTSTTL